MGLKQQVCKNKNTKEHCHHCVVHFVLLAMFDQDCSKGKPQ